MSTHAMAHLSTLEPPRVTGMEPVAVPGRYFLRSAGLRPRDGSNPARDVARPGSALASRGERGIGLASATRAIRDACIAGRRVTRFLRENSYEAKLSCFGGALRFVMNHMVST